MAEQPVSNDTPVKTNTKEDNLVAMRQKYERELAQERARRELLEHELRSKSQPQEEEDDDSEPYVDKKRLNRTLAKTTQNIKQETQGEIHKAVQHALAEERKTNWMKTNSDFTEVMQHADKLEDLDPELAETILKMPDEFERVKLAYRTIKSMGLHKPPQKSEIQDKIDNNRRSPYYQPSGVGTAPYGYNSDYSASGQKSAYDKMIQLKNQLRLG